MEATGRSLNGTHLINDGHTNKVKSINQNIVISAFQRLFTREGKVFGHKKKFKPEIKSAQQKGQRIPVQLKESVQKEKERLLLEKHTEKVRRVNKKMFIQLTVIIVKKDKKVKIALDARQPNEEIVKDEYQVPNIDHLIDLVEEKLEKPKGEPWFSSLDIHYVYDQISLDHRAAEQSNFQKIVCEATGMYIFWTGFHGFTTMPAEFQKIMD